MVAYRKASDPKPTLNLNIRVTESLPATILSSTCLIKCPQRFRNLVNIQNKFNYSDDN
jgi:hypothetical protein